MSASSRLRIRNFAHIREVDLEFGDLTVLVGAQGTGKSIALQWFKVAKDGKQIVQALRDASHPTTEVRQLIDLTFGVGMGAAWNAETRVELDGHSIAPRNFSKRGDGTEHVFFIPAHRSMLVSDGWPAKFQALSPNTPVVARLFSQRLHERLSSGDRLFPLNKLLKSEYREKINDAVFHGGMVELSTENLNRRLNLRHGESNLPYMTWTAGQREFTPLLAGLYDVLPRTNVRKHPDIDWVIVEEPEMGLHPKAITVFMLLVLDLLWRGYRVILSTHSPHVLTTVWMLERLKKYHAPWQRVCEAFEVKSLKHVAEAALKKEYRVYNLAFDDAGKVVSRDISGLDPEALDDHEAGWGGLTEFTSRFGDTVRAAALGVTE